MADDHRLFTVGWVPLSNFTDGRKHAFPDFTRRFAPGTR